MVKRENATENHLSEADPPTNELTTMAMKSIAETADQEKVLIAAHNHPDENPSPKQVADSLDDDYLNTSYVERIMHDFALSPEKREELEGEKDEEDTDETGDSITPEELEQRNTTNPLRSGDNDEDGDGSEDNSQWDFEKDQLKDRSHIESDERPVLSAEDERIDRVIEDATDKQLSLLLYMAAAPHPITHLEAADAAAASQPYIFQVTSFHDNDMIAKVDVDEPESQRPRKLWVLTQPAAEGLNRFVEENGRTVRELLVDVPNVNPAGEWTGDTRDYVLTKGLEIDTDALAIGRTLIEPPQEDVEDPEPRVYESDDSDVRDEEDEPEPEDEAVDEEDEPDPTEALEQLAENDNDPAEAFAGNTDAKLELEEISKQSDKSAYKCDICKEPFDTYRSAKIHATLSEEGDHKGRNGSEPGVVVMNEEFIAELAHNSKGHNGSVSVELDPDSVFVRDEEDEVDEEDEAQEDGHGVPVATDAAEETPRNGRLSTIKKGNVTVTGSVDASSNPFQGIHERPELARREAEQETQEHRSEDGDSTDGSDAGTPVVATLGLTREEAFGLLGSDAPEAIRRRVFDAVMDGED